MKLPLLWIGMLLPLALWAQPGPDTLWTRILGGTGNDAPTIIRTTTDGGCIVAGYVTSDSSDSYLAKVSPHGAMEWERTYRLPVRDHLWDVRELRAGGFIAIGSADSNGVRLLRLNAEGDTLWTRYSRPEPWLAMRGIVELQPSGFMAAGGAASAASQGTRFPYLMTFDSTGRLTHGVGFPQPYHGWPSGYIPSHYSCIEDFADSGSYLLVTYPFWRESYPLYNVDLEWYDSQGNRDWFQFEYEGSAMDGLPDLRLLRSGQRLLRFRANHYDAGYAELTLIGTGVRYHYVGGPIIDLAPLDLIGAAALHWGPSGYDVFQLDAYSFADSNLWTATYGRTSEALSPVRIAADREGGFFICGTSRAEADCTNIFVMRTASALPVTPNPSYAAPNFSLHAAYPNPFNATTTLAFELPQTVMVRLSVFDLLGREVAVLVEGVETAGSHRVGFDGAGLGSGIYFARLSAGDRVWTRKVVLLK